MKRKLFFLPDTKTKTIVISRLENYTEKECGSFTMSADSTTYFDFKFERPDGSRIELHKVSVSEALEIIEGYATKEDILFACGVFFIFGQIVTIEEYKNL